MKAFINKILGRSTARDSKFSRFFREAPLAEKERIIGEVVRKSSEDQKALLERYEQMKTS